MYIRDHKSACHEYRSSASNPINLEIPLILPARSVVAITVTGCWTSQLCSLMRIAVLSRICKIAGAILGRLNGQVYLSIADSNTGVPLDEIEFQRTTPPPSAAIATGATSTAPLPRFTIAREEALKGMMRKVTLAAIVFLLLIALFVLRRAIVRPIIALAGAAEQVAAGQLDQSMSVTTGDEIGTLQRSFNTMVAILGQRTEQLQQQAEAANTARATAEAARAELAEQLRTIEAQRAVIREMNVPILPLSNHALVIPLVGTLDTARLQIAQQRALQAIEQGGIRYALLDVTAVSLIDSHVARGLLNIIQAARLLGAEVVVVGIRPEVAQAIVGLGIQLDQITVRSTLQDGIAYVLSPR